MASNNLRVIYDNIVDASGVTVTASNSSSSGNTPVSNLLVESKAKVWRTDTTGKAILIVDFGTDKIVGGIALPFCNLSVNATIQVKGYPSSVTLTHAGTVASPTVTVTGGTSLFDTGVVNACPYQVLGMWNWGSTPLGVNIYSYGGGTYARVWLTNQTSCRKVTIEITDTTSTGYIEASRLVIGRYWSPKYNTSYGLSSSIKDLTSNARTEAGDLVSTRSVKYNTLSFDLKYLTPSDRSEFLAIVRGNGVSKPMFISLFPNNNEDWDKEFQHQIYGKLAQLSPLQHPIFEMYSTQIEVEEI